MGSVSRAGDIVVCRIYSLEMLYAQASTSSRPQPLEGVPEQLTFFYLQHVPFQRAPQGPLCTSFCSLPMRKVYSLLPSWHT